MSQGCAERRKCRFFCAQENLKRKAFDAFERAFLLDYTKEKPKCQGNTRERDGLRASVHGACKQKTANFS